VDGQNYSQRRMNERFKQLEQWSLASWNTLLSGNQRCFLRCICYWTLQQVLAEIPVSENDNGELI